MFSAVLSCHLLSRHQAQGIGWALLDACGIATAQIALGRNFTDDLNRAEWARFNTKSTTTTALSIHLNQTTWQLSDRAEWACQSTRWIGALMTCDCNIGGRFLPNHVNSRFAWIENSFVKS
jgi:hypothetical protein